ncbi:MAG TPA: division/cell wall cluster transcriptional repressor MraZ [Elusimicrobiota bacterium]|jgi:MraZ protein|nr:division/cell wall cluster transcriptional repressor MraZ [Elusimicrobiota bacterium]HMX42547.1 division/cell wall cluster transcriptional repressor MraZ [Elusimicrobiota bacterium]HMZ26392.1 division/cell wall cluster transcriptional repressor MraZ [Elusimicrobiota bacterium]HNA61316.1 division/cell wall cluster transcriptional repressor MraZ [Elusimicrobiota bacterium]HNC74071.1 division/cell wall cluster transcriptional repressor MraZ [Elusimicrobiota bacterium]
MFLGGEYRHGLDEKRRLALPARLRQNIRRFVLTRGLEGCLSLYTEAEWKKLLSKLDALPVSNKAHARAFKRLLISGAILSDVDGQGRLLVPESLGRYAGITRNVTVVGMESRIELWSSERWEQYRRNAEKSAAKIAAEIDL